MLNILGISGWYYSLSGQPGKWNHGFLACSSPDAIIGAMDSYHRGGLMPVSGVEVDELSDDMWRKSLLDGCRGGVRIKEWYVSKATPVSEINYPKDITEAVIEEALRLELPIPGISV